MAHITHSGSWSVLFPCRDISVTMRLADTQESVLNKNERYGYVLYLQKIIQGIWVWLSLALLYQNITGEKKLFFFSKLWSGPTQTHHNFFDLEILIDPHPLLADEMQRIHRTVDLVKEMRQDIFHSSGTFASYRVAKMLDGNFFSIRVWHTLLIILPLSRFLCSYENVWGERWLDKVGQQDVTPQWGR